MLLCKKKRKSETAHTHTHTHTHSMFILRIAVFTALLSVAFFVSSTVLDSIFKPRRPTRYVRIAHRRLTGEDLPPTPTETPTACPNCTGVLSLPKTVHP